MSRKFRLVLLFGGLLLLLALLGWPLVTRAMSGLLATPAPTPVAVDPYKDQIATLQEELRRTDLTDETRRLEEEKLARFARMATQRVAGGSIQAPRPTGSLTPAGTPIAGIRLPDGIDDHPSVPFSEEDLSVTNSWRKTTPDRSYLVFAGHLAQDPEQGALLVFHPATHTFVPYLTPQRSGGVKIVAETGTLITLESASGLRFYFEAAREQFVDSRGTPLPTPKSSLPTGTALVPAGSYP